MQVQWRCGRERSVFLCGMAVVLTALSGLAQQANQVTPAENSAAAPLTLTLQDALARARTNEPQYRAAITDYGVARQNTVQARAGLLPNVSYNGQFLYNQGNGTSTGRFIASNGVHEYVSEGNVHQSLSLQNAAEYRRARAQEALAKAKSEIATRGLVVTVVQAYYGFVVGPAEVRNRAAGCGRGRTLLRHHAEAGARRRSGALRQHQGRTAIPAGATRLARGGTGHGPQPAGFGGADFSQF